MTVFWGVVVSCGPRPQAASEVKIVGGHQVTAGDAIAQSTVALVSPTGEQFCTGSLITKTQVVTAAHCLEDLATSEIYVMFGTRALPSSISASNTRAVRFAIMNEHFDDRAMAMDVATRPPHDIGFIQLEDPAPAGYDPVAIAGSRDALRVGDELMLAGFGVTHYDAETSGLLYKLTSTVTRIDRAAHELQIDGHSGYSACMGDSGGPAFVRRDGHLQLVGLTSRGSELCDGPVIFTDLRQERAWIAQQQAAL